MEPFFAIDILGTDLRDITRRLYPEKINNQGENGIKNYLLQHIISLLPSVELLFLLHPHHCRFRVPFGMRSKHYHFQARPSRDPTTRERVL